MIFPEPSIEKRWLKSLGTAKRIVSKDVESDDDLANILIWRLARHYNRLFSDPYFRQFTLDELMLEVALLNESERPILEHASETIAENIEEASSLFDEFEDIDPSGDFDSIAQDFMNTGSFKEVPNNE